MNGKSGLTRARRTGYAFGIFTDSLYYNMFYTYYLTFLNEIVGIEPRYSSTIIFISILWDAVTDPIIGAYSDRVGADKRKIMNKAIVPLGLVFIVAWTSIGSGLPGQWMKIVFYTILSMLIWLFYTLYTIPYYAVVAELTDDYDERTEIRSASSLVNALAVGLGNALPALVPTVATLLGARFRSESYAVVAAIMSVLGVAAGFICTRCLKGVYKPKTQLSAGESASLGDTMKRFRDILKMRPARFFLAFVFFFLAGSSMIQSNITYAVIDCIGTDYDTGIIIFIVCMVIAMAVTVPIVEKVAKVKDRRFACIVFLSAAVVGELLLKFFGLDARLGAFPIMNVCMPVVLGIGIGTFWTLFYSMSYDLVEINEYRTGARSESTITAFPQLIQKFGSAVGILLAGNLLSVYGYDASGDLAGKESLFKIETDPHILNGMENISTLFPAILIGVSILFLVLYPVTRKRFTALQAALNTKKAGGEPDESQIRTLLK